MSGNNLVTTIEVYVNGEHSETKSFDESMPAFTIGSGPDALFTLSAEGVSELHAVINQTDRVISDLGPGGITINGVELNSSQELKTGDTIEIGAVRLEISFSDDLGEVKSEALQPVANQELIDDDQTDPDIDFSSLEEQEFEMEPALEYIIRVKSESKDSGGSILEINQVIGPEIWDVKHFSPSENDITIGKEVGYRFRFVGKSVAWVPGLFAKFGWLMYPFTEANREWKSDFYNTTSNNQGSQTIFGWNGDTPVCKIHKNWTGWLYQEKLIKFADAMDQGKFTESADGYSYELERDTCIIVDTGESVFIASRVPQGAAITGGITADMDYPFLGLITSLALLFSFLTYYIVSVMPTPTVDTSDMEERFAELLLEEPPEPPPEEEKKDANPDAGEGAKAKKEEGKVGKKDAKMKEAKGDKVELEKKVKDKEVVDEFLSGVDFGAQNDAGQNEGMAGIASLDAQGGLGGILGAKGTQIGSGGLGSRGSGLGGGGSADGIGGLGTKGSGKGASGYGKGGGSQGKKRAGGSIKSGGNPIILGALDKSLIDAVIKRNMNQIRYCYQRELTKNPSLKGKIVVKFVIAADGTVSKASIKSSSMGSPPVESCIKGRFRRFKFPQPKGGGIVIVSYPFIFSS
jgi:hypothetical protein